jgi:hypothetical protein
MIIRLARTDLTVLERHLPNGVAIGEPAPERDENGDPTGFYLCDHPLLREEDEVVLDEALKRAASVRNGERVLGPEVDLEAYRQALLTSMEERGKDRLDAIRSRRPGVVQ